MSCNLKRMNDLLIKLVNDLNERILILENAITKLEADLIRRNR